MEYGQSILQSKNSSEVEYLTPLLNCLRANARDVLKTLKREDALDKVEFFTNRLHEGKPMSGWKVSL